MYIVAITGASGAVIGVRLVSELLKSEQTVGCIVTEAGWETINYEMFHDRQKTGSIREVLSCSGFECKKGSLEEYSNSDFFSAPASGTSKFKSMIIAPCSMKTLSCVASGYADSLVTRAADVTLKEKRRLILVPRETPLSLIHMENMLKAGKAGADILMPVPAYYTFPVKIDDVTDFFVGKILNLLGLDNDLVPEWGKNR